jgi:hypothetical protein
MSKFFQAVLSGIFFTYFIDFFLLLGIKLNYIDFYEIEIFYNIFFADNQNIYIYLVTSFFIGYLTIYLNAIKTKLFIIGTLFLFSLLSLIQPIGSALGELLFMKKNIILYTDRYSFRGDLYYSGREYIRFYDYDLKKIINLSKKELKQ